MITINLGRENLTEIRWKFHKFSLEIKAIRTNGTVTIYGKRPKFKPVFIAGQTPVLIILLAYHQQALSGKIHCFQFFKQLNLQIFT